MKNLFCTMIRTALPVMMIALLYGIAVQAQEPVRALIVTAHPDDESTFAATVYKITHDLGGTVDMALITNGEGGYKYSTPAEDIYDLELTREEVGREHLPTIRKKELMAGGAIIGIRNYYFLEQKDHQYTLDVDTTLGHVWDTTFVAGRLKEIMMNERYDYVFVLLPTEGTHGHHKGATILALSAVRSLPADRRPVVLGGSVTDKGDTATTVFSGLPGYPITGVRGEGPLFSFDRTQSFGYKNRLNYKIIVNWLIAEHKSQGTMQLYMNGGDIETFWFFSLNDPAAIPKTRALFESMKQQ